MSLNSLHDRFTPALRRPPTQLLQHLDRSKDDRIWAMGVGLDSLYNQITQQSEFEQLVVCDPNNEIEASHTSHADTDHSEGSVEVLEGDCLQRLSAFQEDTFQICIACWMIGTIPVNESLSLLSSVLEEEGQIGFVSMKENTPQFPLDRLQDVVEDVTDRNLPVRGRGELRSQETLSTALSEGNVQTKTTWEGSLPITFSSPDELFSVLRQSTGVQKDETLLDALPEIKDRFCTSIEELRGKNPIVQYEYLGAVVRSES